MAKPSNMNVAPGGGGGRMSGGITGTGGKNVNPVYRPSVEAKALKAANAPVSPGNKGIGGTNVRNALISGKPANPNVTRGGSMRSRLGWDWNN